MKIFRIIIPLMLFLVVILLPSCAKKSDIETFGFNETTPNITTEVIAETTAELTFEATELVTETPTIEIVENPDFRNVKWGFSPEMVIQYETADFYGNTEPTITDNYLVYQTDINGVSAELVYEFNSDMKLISASYTFTSDYGNSYQRYITHYDGLKANLTEKYGVPYEDKIISLNNLSKYADDATALQLGYVAYRTKWQTEITSITAAMMKDGRDIVEMIYYDSLEFEREKDLSGF